MAGAFTVPAMAQDTAKKQLRIGATAGSNYDLLQEGIVPQLKAKGYTVKLIEFNDYVQPNLALADGSLDANFFQHEVYFNQFKGDRKLDLTALVRRHQQLRGSYRTPERCWLEVVEFMQTHQDQLRLMITHRVPLAQAGHGFELARARLASKVLIQPGVGLTS